MCSDESIKDEVQIKAYVVLALSGYLIGASVNKAVSTVGEENAGRLYLPNAARLKI